MAIGARESVREVQSWMLQRRSSELGNTETGQSPDANRRSLTSFGMTTFLLFSATREVVP